MDYAFGPDADKSNIVPKGIYRAEITTCVEKTSKSGNPMLEIDFEVIEPEGFSECLGLRHYLVFTPAAERMVYRDLGALGLTVKPGSSFEIEPDQMVGLKAVVRVVHEEWEGEMRAKIGKLTADTGVGSIGTEPKPDDPASQEMPF